MKRNYCLSLVLLALFGVSAPFAANAAVESVLSSQSTQQAKKITGKVLDAAGEPIIGASVLVKGSGTGAVTDIDGNFSVEAPVGSTLEVSFIGYKTVTLKVTNATTYTVSLQDDSQALDEVVVTAMGIKKERKAFNFFHFMIDLQGGPCVAKRLSGCGSGTEYLAVTPWGDLYPCHQFVGNEKFLMGNVDTGVVRDDIRDEFKCCNVYAKDKCKKCFAKFYCSGGCAANSYNFHGNINDAYDIGCELQRKRIECAIMLKAAEAAEASEE